MGRSTPPIRTGDTFEKVAVVGGSRKFLIKYIRGRVVACFEIFRMTFSFGIEAWAPSSQRHAVKELCFFVHVFTAEDFP